jgi:SP family general alpha glucoside:H+ symporter-like MFS transporter
MSDSVTKEMEANISPAVTNATSNRPTSAQVENSSLNEKNAQRSLAQHGGELEHHLGPLAAVKAYPMAIFWSVMVSMCVIMEGYE